MKNFTFIKNIKGGLGITLSSYDMMLPERTFVIPYNADRIAIPEQYALGLFISEGALNQYRNGFFTVQNIDELEAAAATIGLFAEQEKVEIYSKEEIEKALKANDHTVIDKVLERQNYVETTNLITSAREQIDSLSKSAIDKIGKACGVELEIE